MPMIRARAIKPKRIKLGVFQEELLAHAKPVTEGILTDYQAGVASWSHVVQFDVTIDVDHDGVNIVVDTDDQIYLWNHEGTSAHNISASPGKSLVFMSEFGPKTVPGRIKSGPGYVGGTTVFTPSVLHPGNEGRKQSIPIANKWRPFFNRQMKRAVQKAVTRSGHAI